MADSVEPTQLPPGLLLSFYGDDFTGSTDGMEALARVGLRTVLFLSPPSPEQLARFEGLRAVGVAGVSRSLPPAAMDVELPPIFRQLRELPAPLFHAKVCSTFDSSPEIGSIGHTIDIGQRYFASPFVPLVVGAPILNRFCIFGNLFARSGPESDVYRLDRHPTMSRHPVTPMHESDLRLHLARQTSRRIGLIDALELAQTTKALEATVNTAIASGAEILLFDTLMDDHLVVIGREIWRRARHDQPLFAIGSSGVEYALTAYWRACDLLPPPPIFYAEPIAQTIVVSGSCSPVTARQIQWGLDNDFVEIPLSTAELTDEAGLPDEAAMEKAIAATVRAAGLAWASGRSVIIHTCRGPEDPRLATARAVTERRDHGPVLGRALGRILGALIAQTDVRRAIVTGGDISCYVARELGIEALEVQTPMAPGSPLCRIYSADTRLNGMEMLFKGGQVGKIDLFGSVLKGRT